MYVSIHSKAVGGKSKGKKSWGVVSDLAKSAQVSRPHLSDSIGRHAWAVSLKGSSVHEYSSGVRFGRRSEVESEVLVELTPKDVTDLVNLALSMGLVEVRALK